MGIKLKLAKPLKKDIGQICYRMVQYLALSGSFTGHIIISQGVWLVAPISALPCCFVMTGSLLRPRTCFRAERATHLGLGGRNDLRRLLPSTANVRSCHKYPGLSPVKSIIPPYRFWRVMSDAGGVGMQRVDQDMAVHPRGHGGYNQYSAAPLRIPCLPERLAQPLILSVPARMGGGLKDFIADAVGDGDAEMMLVG